MIDTTRVQEIPQPPTKETYMTEFTITKEELAPFCEGFDSAQLDQARDVCIEYKLTPLKRQIHFNLRSKKLPNGAYGKTVAFLVTIDGLRGIAERSEKY